MLQSAIDSEYGIKVYLYQQEDTDARNFFIGYESLIDVLPRRRDQKLIIYEDRTELFRQRRFEREERGENFILLSSFRTMIPSPIPQRMSPFHSPSLSY